MSEQETIDEVVKEVAEETRKAYSLTDRLRNRPMRTKTVTVYLDEVLGEELGDARDRYEHGINMGDRIRTGVLGEIDVLEPVVRHAREVLENRSAHTDERIAEVEKILAEAEPRLKELEERAADLREKMKADSITFHLQAVPPVIIKDCHRKAKKALGIKGKSIPENLDEAYEDEFSIQVVIASVASYTDNGAGVTQTGIEHDDAEGLIDLLPKSEWARFDGALGDLQFKNSIAENVADDADF